MAPSSALTFSAGYPSNDGILKASCVTGAGSLLLYPSRTQEGPVPSLSRFGLVLDVGSVAWISREYTINSSFLVHYQPEPHTCPEPPVASSGHHPLHVTASIVRLELVFLSCMPIASIPSTLIE
jgi:hypothetical protein